MGPMKMATTLQIKNERELDNLTKLLDAMLSDYREFLTGFTETRNSGIAFEYAYGRVFALKGYFERAVTGLDRISFRYSVAQKLNGQLEGFFLQATLLSQRLRRFIEECAESNLLRMEFSSAANRMEEQVSVERYRGRMLLSEEPTSLDVLGCITALDDLRLYLNERKKWGLEVGFGLERKEESLESEFGLIENFFWEQLSQIGVFAKEIREYRRRFLILQEEEYPWWYPERQRIKAING